MPSLPSLPSHLKALLPVGLPFPQLLLSLIPTCCELVNVLHEASVGGLRLLQLLAKLVVAHCKLHSPGKEVEGEEKEVGGGEMEREDIEKNGREGRKKETQRARRGEKGEEGRGESEVQW